VTGRSGSREPRKERPTRRDSFAPRELLATYRPELAQALAKADVAAFRYAQVLEHLLRRPFRPFAEASALPTDLRISLDGLAPAVLTPVATRMAPDGTTKLLLAANDGAEVEAVLMPYGNKITVCLSSQVGCAVGCVFCATGAMGFRRNLSAAEIVDQLRAAAIVTSAAGQRISNVVYMGMGEPMLNLGAVLDSIRVLTEPAGLGLGHRSLSVSTVGIPAGMLRLGRAQPQVNLALSLHAADDTTRALLVPRQYRHPLPEILEAAWEHFAITRRKLLVEYVLLAGINDSIADAQRLAGLLRGHVVAVNLLAWNPVGLEMHPVQAQEPEPRRRGTRGAAGTLPRQVPGAASAASAPRSVPSRSLRPSSPAAIAAFRAALRAAHVETVVRQSKGAGIGAACGQLAASRASYG
jgi:23S rRNA (adenine2503-C2)-methyltransferase